MYLNLDHFIQSGNIEQMPGGKSLRSALRPLDLES